MLALAVFDNIRSFFNGIKSYPLWQVGLELLLIGSIVYWVVRFLQGTRGARLLRGIVTLLIALYLVVELLGSVGGYDTGRILFLYQGLLSGVGFAIAVAFQPELRRALMKLGETRLFRGVTTSSNEQTDALVETALFCSRRKIGLLIAIERDVGLGGVAESGIRIDAELTPELLETIAWPNSPLHDLGVIVSGGRVAYAGVQFPLAEEGELEKELGSRHRAAVGMSQESDAVLLVVSEETGAVSIAIGGNLLRKIAPDRLRAVLDTSLSRGSNDATRLVEQTSPNSQIIRVTPAKAADRQEEPV